MYSQAGVPEAIRDLRAAGVVFWMLTGDKYSTALQVAS
jgi:P-type E1-E2 ATPase